MSARRALLLVASAALSATIAVVLATRTDASKSRPLSRISNPGREVALQRGELTRRLGVVNATLLAVRGGRAYYLLHSAHGPCAATGAADKLGDLGSVDCPLGPFPTAERPLLDLSVYEATVHDEGDLSLYRAEGLTADGVAVVAFVRADGTVALRVPVNRNVYSSTSVPSGPIAAVVALDRGGKQLWRSGLTRGG
jgi:hypothetical protein